MVKKVAKPFLKWAGGKGQLLAKFEEMYPNELINGEIDTYIEPFVGGGAVLGLLAAPESLTRPLYVRYTVYNISV